jgi:hypothetical protein
MFVVRKVELNNHDLVLCVDQLMHGNRGGDVGVGVRLHKCDSESSLLSFSELHYPDTPSPPPQKMSLSKTPFPTLLCDSRCTKELSEHRSLSVLYASNFLMYYTRTFHIRHNKDFMDIAQ